MKKQPGKPTSSAKNQAAAPSASPKHKKSQPRSPWSKLTLHQRRFLTEFISSGKLAESAKNAGSKNKQPGAAAYQLMKNPNVQAALADCLDRAGLTDDYLAQRLREGVDAIETKFFSYEGKVTDQVDVIPWDTRHTYLHTALKAKGHLRNQIDVGIEGEIHVRKITELVAPVDSPEEWERIAQEELSKSPNQQKGIR